MKTAIEEKPPPLPRKTKRSVCFYCHGSKVNPGNTGHECSYCYGHGELDVVVG